jgi:Flp pilus assembly protein TadG
VIVERCGVTGTGRYRPNPRRRPPLEVGAERGSVSVLAAAMICVTLLLALLSADAARLLSAVARAQTAADAAALAAAQELAIPSAADAAALAAAYAASNGGVLIECACAEGGGEVIVRVQVDPGETFVLPSGRSVEARARAVLEIPPG